MFLCLSLVTPPFQGTRLPQKEVPQYLSPLSTFTPEVHSLLNQVTLSRFYFMREDGESVFNPAQVEQMLRFEKEFRSVRSLPLIGDQLGMAIFFLKENGSVDLFVVQTDKEGAVQVQPLLVDFIPSRSIQAIDSGVIKEALEAVGEGADKEVIKESLKLNMWLEQFLKLGAPIPERDIALEEVDLSSFEPVKIDQIDLEAAWTLAEILREKGSNSAEIKKLFEDRIDFKDRLVTLYQGIQQGEVPGAIPFSDPSRMFVSPRDQKRWINETIKWLRAGFPLSKAIFMGALVNYIENIDPNQIGQDGKPLVENGLEIFVAVFQSYFKDERGRAMSRDQILPQVKEWMKEQNYPGLPVRAEEDLLEMQQRIRSQVRHALFNETPSLFLKHAEEGEFVEEILKEETLALNGKWIVMPMGPYSDKNQILGRRIPERIISFDLAQEVVRKVLSEEGHEEKIREALTELIPVPTSHRQTDAHVAQFKSNWEQFEKGALEGEELARAIEMIRWTASFLETQKAGQGLSFSKGTLIRAYESAMSEPNKPIVLVLDNIDASSAKVRNGIFNHFLEKREMNIVGYVNPFDGSSRITLPKNLHLIFTASSQVPVKDQALLNRLQKYVLPEVTIEDRLALALARVEEYYDGTRLKLIGPTLVEVFKEFENYLDEEILPFYPSVVTHLFERLEGLAKEKGEKWTLDTLATELHLILLDQIPNPEKRQQFKVYLDNKGFPFYEGLVETPYWFDESGDLVVYGVTVGLNEGLKERIRAVTVSERNLEKRKWAQERELYLWRNSPQERKAGVVLQSQSIRMLASLVRQIKYNNRVIQVVGPTGVGKTFVGEALAIWRNQSSYSEPTHKRSEQEQWTGFYEITAAGEFVYNDQTPFMDMIRNGGADLKSELNAKGDFNRTAYMSWYLNQIAKKRKSLVLPFVRDGELNETSEEPIHDNYWMLIDINPEGVYGHRYRLNPELASLSGQIYLDGNYTSEDYKKMLRMALEESALSEGQKTKAIALLSEVHQTLAEALIAGEFAESDSTVLTLRELLNRSLNQLLGLTQETSSLTFEEMLSQVVEDNYLSFWNAEEDYLLALEKVNPLLKSVRSPEVRLNRHVHKQVEKQLDRWLNLALKNKSLRSIPPVHLRFAVESDGADVGAQLAKKNNWGYEKALISGFTEEYDLKGAFIPIRQQFTLKEAEELIATYEALDPEYVRQVTLEVLQDINQEDKLVIAERLYSVERARRWNAQLKWAGGLLVRKILEAQEQSEKVFLVELEGFHRLDPEVAIMLNEFFLSGTLYLPGREPMIIPKNLIFFLSSPIEIPLEISPAEQSRHWRVTLYDHEIEQKIELINRALQSSSALATQVAVRLQIVTALMEQWKGLNQLLEEQDREEFVRGTSYWTSYAQTIAYLYETNGNDLNAALEKGKTLFLGATFGSGMGEEQETIPIQWKDNDEENKMSFLNDFSVLDFVLDHTIGTSEEGGAINEESLETFLDEVIHTNNTLQEKINNLLNGQNQHLKSYPHKNLNPQVLRSGDLVLFNEKYLLFLGWDSKGKPLLLRSEKGHKMVRIHRSLPKEAVLLSRVHLEEHAAELKEFLALKQEELLRVRYQNVFSKLRFLRDKVDSKEVEQVTSFLDTLLSDANIKEFQEKTASVQKEFDPENDTYGVVIVEGRLGVVGDGKVVLLGDQLKTLVSSPASFVGRKGQFVPFSAFAHLGIKEVEVTRLNEEGEKKLGEAIHFIGLAQKGSDITWWLKLENHLKLANSILGQGGDSVEALNEWIGDNEEVASTQVQTTLSNYGLTLADVKYAESFHLYNLPDSDAKKLDRLEKIKNQLRASDRDMAETDAYQYNTIEEVVKMVHEIPDELFVLGKWLKRYFEVQDLIKIGNQVYRVSRIEGPNVIVETPEEELKTLTLQEVETARILSLEHLSIYISYQTWMNSVKAAFEKETTLQEWKDIFRNLTDLLLYKKENIFPFINGKSSFWQKLLTEVYFPLTEIDPNIFRYDLLGAFNVATNLVNIAITRKIEDQAVTLQVSALESGELTWKQFLTYHKKWSKELKARFESKFSELEIQYAVTADALDQLETTPKESKEKPAWVDYWETVLDEEIEGNISKAEWQPHPYNADIGFINVEYTVKDTSPKKPGELPFNPVFSAVYYVDLRDGSLKELAKSQKSNQIPKVIPLRRDGFLVKTFGEAKWPRKMGPPEIRYFNGQGKTLPKHSMSIDRHDLVEIVPFQDKFLILTKSGNSHNVQKMTIADNGLIISGRLGPLLTDINKKYKLNVSEKRYEVEEEGDLVSMIMGSKDVTLPPNLLPLAELSEIELTHSGKKLTLKQKKQKRVIEEEVDPVEQELLLVDVVEELEGKVDGPIKAIEVLDHPYNDEFVFIQVDFENEIEVLNRAYYKVSLDSSLPKENRIEEVFNNHFLQSSQFVPLKGGAFYILNQYTRGDWWVKAFNAQGGFVEEYTANNIQVVSLANGGYVVAKEVDSNSWQVFVHSADGKKTHDFDSIDFIKLVGLADGGFILVEKSLGNNYEVRIFDNAGKQKKNIPVSSSKDIDIYPLAIEGFVVHEKKTGQSLIQYHSDGSKKVEGRIEFGSVLKKLFALPNGGFAYIRQPATASVREMMNYIGPDGIEDTSKNYTCVRPSHSLTLAESEKGYVITEWLVEGETIHSQVERDLGLERAPPKPKEKQVSVTSSGESFQAQIQSQKRVPKIVKKAVPTAVAETFEKINVNIETLSKELEYEVESVTVVEHPYNDQFVILQVDRLLEEGKIEQEVIFLSLDEWLPEKDRFLPAVTTVLDTAKIHLLENGRTVIYLDIVGGPGIVYEYNSKGKRIRKFADEEVKLVITSKGYAIKESKDKEKLTFVYADGEEKEKSLDPKYTLYPLHDGGYVAVGLEGRFSSGNRYNVQVLNSDGTQRTEFMENSSEELRIMPLHQGRFFIHSKVGNEVLKAYDSDGILFDGGAFGSEELILDGELQEWIAFKDGSFGFVVKSLSKGDEEFSYLNDDLDYDFDKEKIAQSILLFETETGYLVTISDGAPVETESVTLDYPQKPLQAKEVVASAEGKTLRVEIETKVETLIIEDIKEYLGETDFVEIENVRLIPNKINSDLIFAEAKVKTLPSGYFQKVLFLVDLSKDKSFLGAPIKFINLYSGWVGLFYDSLPNGEFIITVKDAPQMEVLHLDSKGESLHELSILGGRGDMGDAYFEYVSLDEGQFLISLSAQEEGKKSQLFLNTWPDEEDAVPFISTSKYIETHALANGHFLIKAYSDSLMEWGIQLYDSKGKGKTILSGYLDRDYANIFPLAQQGFVVSDMDRGKKRKVQLYNNEGAPIGKPIPSEDKVSVYPDATGGYFVSRYVIDKAGFPVRVLEQYNGGGALIIAHSFDDGIYADKVWPTKDGGFVALLKKEPDLDLTADEFDAGELQYFHSNGKPIKDKKIIINPGNYIFDFTEKEDRIDFIIVEKMRKRRTESIVLKEFEVSKLIPTIKGTTLKIQRTIPTEEVPSKEAESSKKERIVAVLAEIDLEFEKVHETELIEHPYSDEIAFIEVRYRGKVDGFTEFKPKSALILVDLTSDKKHVSKGYKVLVDTISFFDVPYKVISFPEDRFVQVVQEDENKYVVKIMNSKGIQMGADVISVSEPQVFLLSNGNLAIERETPSKRAGLTSMELVFLKPDGEEIKSEYIASKREGRILVIPNGGLVHVKGEDAPTAIYYDNNGKGDEGKAYPNFSGEGSGEELRSYADHNIDVEINDQGFLIHLYDKETGVKNKDKSIQITVDKTEVVEPAVEKSSSSLEGVQVRTEENKIVVERIIESAEGFQLFRFEEEFPTAWTIKGMEQKPHPYNQDLVFMEIAIEGLENDVHKDLYLVNVNPDLGDSEQRIVKLIEGIYSPEITFLKNGDVLVTYKEIVAGEDDDDFDEIISEKDLKLVTIHYKKDLSYKLGIEIDSAKNIAFHPLSNGGFIATYTISGVQYAELFDVNGGRVGSMYRSNDDLNVVPIDGGYIIVKKMLEWDVTAYDNVGKDVLGGPSSSVKPEVYPLVNGGYLTLGYERGWVARCWTSDHKQISMRVRFNEEPTSGLMGVTEKPEIERVEGVGFLFHTENRVVYFDEEGRLVDDLGKNSDQVFSVSSNSVDLENNQFLFKSGAKSRNTGGRVSLRNDTIPFQRTPVEPKKEDPLQLDFSDHKFSITIPSIQIKADQPAEVKEKVSLKSILWSDFDLGGEIVSAEQVAHPYTSEYALVKVKHKQVSEGVGITMTTLLHIDLRVGEVGTIKKIESTFIKDGLEVYPLKDGTFIVKWAQGIDSWLGWRLDQQGEKISSGASGVRLSVGVHPLGGYYFQWPNGKTDFHDIGASDFDPSEPKSFMIAQVETTTDGFKVVVAAEGDSFREENIVVTPVDAGPVEGKEILVEVSGSNLKIGIETEERNFKDEALKTSLSALGLAPVELAAGESSWSEFEVVESQSVDTSEIEGNNGAYTDSFGRIRYIRSKDGFVLNIDGFEIPVYDKEAADAEKGSYLIPIERHVRALARHVEAIRKGRMVFNVGPPGSGKTAVGLDLANRLGLPTHVKPQHGMVDEKELFGEWIQDEKGNYVLTSEFDYIDLETGEARSELSREQLDLLRFQELKKLGVKRKFKSTFLDFFFNGGVYIFDEGAVGRRGKKLLELLTSLARGDKQLFLNKSPAQGGMLLKQHPLFHVIITSNEGREPISPDLMAELDTYFMNNDFTDRELEKILYSIYRNAPNLTDKERFSLIQRQIRVHRSILALLEYSDDGERLAEVYQFGLREIIFAAKDIVAYLDRFPKDKELAFVDKIHSAYYKLLQTPEERSAVLKIIQRHFRPVEEAGNQLLRRIEIISRSMNNPYYQGKILTDLAIAKYVRGRTPEQFQSVTQDLQAIQDPVMRVEAFIKLIETVAQSGFERDKNAIVKLTLILIAQVTDISEKSRLLRQLKELAGEKEIEIDSEYYVVEVRSLTEAINQTSDEAALKPLVEQLQSSLGSLLSVKDGMELVEESLTAFLSIEQGRVRDLDALMLIFEPILEYAIFTRSEALWKEILFGQFEKIRFSKEDVKEYSFSLYYATDWMDQYLSKWGLLELDGDVEVSQFFPKDHLYFLYLSSKNRATWIEQVNITAIKKEELFSILSILILKGDLDHFKQVTNKFKSLIDEDLYEEVLAQIAWAPPNKMRSFVKAMISLDPWKKYKKERFGVRLGLDSARAELLTLEGEAAEALDPYEELEGEMIPDELMALNLSGNLVKNIFWSLIKSNTDLTTPFGKQAIRRDYLEQFKKPEENYKIIPFFDKELLNQFFIKENLEKNFIEVFSLLEKKENKEEEFSILLEMISSIKPNEEEEQIFSFSSSDIVSLTPKIVLTKAEKMLKKLQAVKEKLLSQSDPRLFIQELDSFIKEFEAYLTYLRFLDEDVEEGAKSIVDLSLAADFSQIEAFNEQSSEPDRLIWLSAALKLIDYLREEETEGDIESVERYADALYLNFGLGAERQLKVTRDEKSVYISDVKLLRGNEVSSERSATVPFIRSEESAIRGIAQGFAGKVATISLLENGARIDDILTFLANEMGYRRVSMAGTRFKSVETLFGGIEIFESVDLESRKEVSWSPGLITRYMVEEPNTLSEESVILDIRNLHQIPRDVRSTLFQLLQDGYWDVYLGEGEKKRLYLPKNVKLHFTLPAGVEGDLESALFSRVEKVFVSGLRYDPEMEWELREEMSSLTELETVIQSLHGLSTSESKLIGKVLTLLYYDDGGFYLDPDRAPSQWEGGFYYDIHAGDGLEIAAWIKQAFDYEQAKLGRSLNSSERRDLALLEIYRYVMMKVREVDQEKIDKNFQTFFRFTPPKMPVMKVDKETGLVLEVMGVGVSPNETKAKRPEEVDPNYRLTLVPSMAWRLSGILRAMSPRKDRFDRLKPGRSVLTVGNSSMGKTTAGGFLTQILGLEDYFVFSVDGQTEESDLTWEYVANPQAGQRTEDGLRVHGRFAKSVQPFLERFKQDNQVIMIDEINLKPEILSFFVLLAQGAEHIYLDIPGEESQFFKRGKNVTVLLSMNEEDEELFSGRGALDRFLKAEQVTIRFPSKYLREEEIAIDEEMGGLRQEANVEVLDLSPAVRKRLSEVARVGHWPPMSTQFDPDFIRRLLKALEQDGLKGMAALLKGALSSGKEVGLDEEKIKAIIREVKAKSLVPAPMIPLVEMLLNGFLEQERILIVRKEYADKIDEVTRIVKTYTAKTEVPVTQVVVGDKAFFVPATGLLSLSYKDVAQRSYQKLLGIARHEIGHVLFTRFDAMKKVIDSKTLSPEAQGFFERVFKRAAGDESFWQYFIAEREDVWINFVMSNSENELDPYLWEDNWYEYYFKSRIAFGMSESEAIETAQTKKKKPLGLTRDEKVILRPADLTSVIEVPEKERILSSYFQNASSHPHMTFSNELFRYAHTGSYSLMFEELRKSPERLHQEIVQRVEESQPEYDLVSIGENDLGETDTQIKPDRTIDRKRFSNTSKHKAAIERETQRAVEYTLRKFAESPTLISNFMALFDQKKKPDPSPAGGPSPDIPPEVQDLLDQLSDATQSAQSGGESKPGEGEAGEGKPGEGQPGEGEVGEGKPSEGQPGEGEVGEGKSSEGQPGEGDAGSGETGELGAAETSKGIGESMKDFKPSPKDGDLEGAINEILEGMKSKPKSKPGTSKSKPSSASPSSVESKSATAVEEADAMKKYLEAVAPEKSKAKSSSAKVKEYISKVTQSSRRYARQIRRVLLGQAQREYEIYSRGGGRFSLQRFLEWKQKFMVKTIEETDIETIDVELLIDLSGSMGSAKEQLANLAVLMAAELGDLGDVGINFQIRGLDHTGVPVMFRPFQVSRGKLKKVKPEELLEMFEQMLSHIGNHGAEDFTQALVQSKEAFKGRKTKHKLVFLVSDGQDTSGRLSEGTDGRWVNGNPGFRPILDQLEKEKVSVIGIGISDGGWYGSKPINMFDRYIELGNRSDLIGEFILNVIKDKVTKSRNRPLPEGNLEERYKILSKKSVDPGSLGFRSKADLLTLLDLQRRGLVDDLDHQMVLDRLSAHSKLTESQLSPGAEVPLLEGLGVAPSSREIDISL